MAARVGDALQICVLVGALLVVGALGQSVSAQTGPGGVGTSDGTSDLRLWVRGEDGIQSDGGGVTDWIDQSGYGNDLFNASSPSGDNIGQPQESGAPGFSVVRFTDPDPGTDGDGQSLDSPTLGIPGGGGFTYFVVVDVYGEVTAETVDNNGGDAGGGTFIFDRTSSTDAVASLKVSNEDAPPQFGFQKRDNNGNGLGGPTSEASVDTEQGNFQIVGIQRDYGNEYRIFVDGTLERTAADGDGDITPPGIRLGAHKERDALNGDVAEFAAYEGALNKAKRVVVQNYLAAKYSSKVSLAGNDQFAHGEVYGNDVAGIGQASDGSQHLSAQSAELRIQAAGGDLSNGEYLLLGHDDQSLSFNTNEKPNGDGQARKVQREWRADLDASTLTANESRTVDVTVDLSSLSLPASTNDYAIFVDDDGDFSSGATFYDLDASGQATDVQIGDDDYVTIAAVQRTVTFASSESANFENEGGGAQGAAYAPTSITVELNYPTSTDISGIPYSVSEGTTSTLREDTDNTFNSGDGGQEDYRRTGGTFTFPASAGTGPFNFNTNGATNAGAPALEILNDGLSPTEEPGEESSPEDLEVALSTDPADYPADVAVGATTTHTFSINDDDDPRKISFSGTTGKSLSTVATNPEEDSDPNNDNLSGDENTVGTVTFEVALPSGETGSTSTFAIFEVTGADPDDFEIPANGDNNKLTERRGEVKVPAGARHATFDLTITDESVFEADETLTVELTSARSATLDPSGDANLDFAYTILNDDTEPAVSFVSPSESGGEGRSDVRGTLRLATPSEVDLDVDFGVDGTATGGDDYAQITTSPVTIDAGDIEKEVRFTVAEDSTLEGPETIAVTINDNAATDPPVGSPATFTYTITDNDQLGATGPGGVGSASSTPVWLRADAISGVSDGDNLSTWRDESGNGNDATQTSAGQRPTYQSSVPSMNGRPVVRFEDPNEGTTTGNGDGDFLDTESPGIDPTSGFTYFIVADLESDVSPGGATDGDGTYVLDRPSSVSPLVSLKVIDDGSGPRLAYQTRYDDGNSDGLKGAVSGTAPGTALGSPRLVTLQREVGNEFRIFVNGNQEAAVPDDGRALTPPSLRIGSHAEDDAMDGDVGEVIVFEGTLNSTTQTLVQNYLAAKYGIVLDTGNGAKDVYAGDQNGNYDRGVLGIGREGSGDFHPAAESDGLRLESEAGLSNGDYLVAGHRTPSNSVNTSDVGGVGGLEARSERTWFVDKTGSPTADVTISLSEAGLTGPAGDPANYVLLTRSDTTGGGDWSTVGGTPAVANADEVTFSSVSLSDEHEITLGTTNRTESPLNTNNLVITGTDGTDGADQGWRYMGLPVTGGTAADLLDADGNAYINVNAGMAQTNDGGDGTGSGWAPITDPSTALTNGRGFILWLYDSPQYPVDPSVTLQTAGGLTAPGDNDVVVGNGPIDEDPSLNQSDEFFMLANPYATPYDLGSLGGGSDGFDDNVKVWLPNATAPSGRDDGNAGSFTDLSRSGGDDIASWQGFLAVRSSTGSGNTSLTFGSAGRAPGATVDFVGSKSGEADAPTQHRVPLRLVGRDADGTLVALDRAASVLFRTGTSTGRDRFDSPKLEPMTSAYATIAPVASTAKGAVLRSAESRPLPSSDAVTVPLAFQRKNVGGTFTIAMPAGGDRSTRTPSYPSDWTVTLIDTKGTSDPTDDATHPLTPGGSGYTFEAGTSTSASAATAKKGAARATPPEPRLRRLTLPTDTTAKASGGASSTRFRLRIDGTGTALPVEMAGLSAQRDDRRAVLEWTTASEDNNAGFTVQHQRLPADDTTATTSAADWTDLGFVDGAGTTTEATDYRFRTDALAYGRHVFRLRQVNTDGTATTTDQVDVEVRLKKRYAVEPPYPNPARQQARLPVTVKTDQRVTVEVYDLLGRRVHVVRNRALRGQETTLISLPVRTLASGAYFVRVRGKQFATTQRLMVVH
jgi:hypothetical protein